MLGVAAGDELVTVVAVERLHPYPVSGFAALTLAIWVNRTWLAWTNPDDTVAEKVVWSLPITAFVVIATIIVVLMLRQGDRSSGLFVNLVRFLAGGTIVYWLVRLPLIYLNDHEAAFLVVHTVFAMVSMLAALLAAHAIGAGGLGPSRIRLRRDRR